MNDKLFYSVNMWRC